MQDRTLAAFGSYPFTDVRQVFQRNSPTGVVRGFYDLLRDNMIYIGGKASFLTRKPLQFTFCRTRLLPLQLGAQLAMPIANTFDCLALVEGSITGYGNVGNPQVNTKESFWFSFWRFFNVARLEQVELAVVVDQIALAAQPGKQLGLMLAANERHLLTARHSPDGDHTLGELVRNQPVIEGEGCQGLERALAFLVKLVGVGNLSKDTHGHISADSEAGANVGVAELVQGELPERSFLPGHVTHVVARGVSGLKRLLKCRVLFWRRLELQLCDQLHSNILPSIGRIVKLEDTGDGAIPLCR